MIVSELFSRLANLVGPQVAVILLTALGIIAGQLIYRQILIAVCFFSSRSRALSAVGRVYTKDGPREGKGLWLQPTSKPDHYDEQFGTKVLVVGNNKGGVAKTTLVANLGAYWAREWNKKVLLIDLDYQGTLSSMALRATPAWLPKGQDSLATRAISGDLEPSIFVQCAKQVPDEPNLRIIPAYYDLAQADNRLIVEWLLHCNPRKRPLLRMIADSLIGKLFVRQDIRYILAELLQSAAVRKEFDVVIIDCPPRVTTGVVQALCAATHVLIPTILDLPSSEAVVAYCEELETLRKGDICPKLSYVGVIGTMTSRNVDQVAERDAIRLIADALNAMRFPSGLVDQENFIRDNTSFVNDAEDGIAYLAMGNNDRQRTARDEVRRLATYVASRIGLPP